MRGFLLITTFLFISNWSFAQLTVIPSQSGQTDQYIYVKGDLLYVNADLKLNKNPSSGREPSIFLRDEAQLLQGEGEHKNTGTGLISVFSEGTANAYDYNYWGSPVISPEKGHFGVALLHSPVSILQSAPAQLSPSLNGKANPLTISTRWIYTFTGNGYANWNFVGDGIVIPPGYGFTMKGTDGIDPTFVDGRANNPGNAQRYDFRGRPNSGKIEIPVKENDFVLLGNPYPSGLDLSLFLLENSGQGTLKTGCYGDLDRRNITTGIAYFWDSKEDGSSHYLQDYIGGYGAYSPVDPCTTGVYEVPVFKKVLSGEDAGSKGKNFDPRILSMARGFMVQAVQEGKVIFQNGQRVFKTEKHQTSQKETASAHKKHIEQKEPVELSKIQLIFSVDNLYERRLSMAFWNEATPGIDAGMDAEAFEMAATDAGWLHEERSFVIDVRPMDISDEIPLFLKVHEAHSKISFSQGFSESTDINNLFILDTETNDYSAITEEGLTFELPPGTYHGRFRLSFAEKISQEELPQVFFEDVSVLPKFDIVQNNYLKELEIIGNDQFPVKAVGVFDLQGKRMLYRTNFDNRRSISIGTSYWANAVYIVKVTGMDNTKTIKKITVFNK
ncbi:T9SS type A sorting domain-containing protein [Salinimicrobium xinjiangense]|uniref:hypothetical protein n=1 Tax=Salinimicrobium xinjiangense TaxID=438596 RepID=UPI0004243CA4|nr:hypothetical protein [Salinimicrobium xinjiangense]